MKKLFGTLLIVTLIVHYTMANETLSPQNTNSWSIGIGKKVLLASWLENNAGDEIVVNSNNFKQSDTLYATRYFCGGGSETYPTQLIVKNDKGEIVQQSITTANGFFFWAGIPFSSILQSNTFTGQRMWVYLSIDNNPELLGKIIFSDPNHRGVLKAK